MSQREAATPYRGVVVLGSPRSGTTLLRRLLNAHPDIACPPETCLFGACARFLSEESVGDEVPFGVLSGLAFAGIEARDVLDRLRSLAFGLMDDIAAKQGSRVWAEKTAIDSFHVPEIEALCGSHVRYICVTRHGLDVVKSLHEYSAKGMGYLRDLHPYIAKTPRVLEGLAAAWVDANRAVRTLAERRADEAVWIRYEDLVANADATMADLFRFLELPPAPDVVQQALHADSGVGFDDWKAHSIKTISGASIGRWKSLPRATLFRLGEIVAEELVASGYDAPPKARRDESRETAMRRYELGIRSHQMRAEDEG